MQYPDKPVTLGNIQDFFDKIFENFREIEAKCLKGEEDTILDDTSSDEGWQPISTAPRDAHLVDVWAKIGYRVPDAAFYPVKKHGGVVTAWWDRHGVPYTDDELSHWRPIPEGPV